MLLYYTRWIASVALPGRCPQWPASPFQLRFFQRASRLVKRYVELAVRIDKELPIPGNPTNRLADLPSIERCGGESVSTQSPFLLYYSRPLPCASCTSSGDTLLSVPSAFIASRLAVASLGVQLTMTQSSSLFMTAISASAHMIGPYRADCPFDIKLFRACRVRKVFQCLQPRTSD